MRTVVAAFDKWRGSATGAQACAAAAVAARACGWDAAEVPLSDGGEGFLDALGGEVRAATVDDPLGRRIAAEWRLRPATGAYGATGVVESARASGLGLVGGSKRNDPWKASSAGTGQLVAAAARAGVARVLVGLGGSATTDGGRGAVDALVEAGARDGLLDGIEIVTACDVMVPFFGAVDFAAQKGASPAAVERLAVRLQETAGRYRDELGADVVNVPGAGAAGGLGGGLAALGSRLVSGFDLVASEVGLAEHLDRADLVVTGEGRLDAASFRGKVVGGVVAMARRAGVPVLVVTGEVAAGAPDPGPGVTVASLVAMVGRARAWSDPAGGIAGAVRAFVATRF